jgi:hypothetical protein
MENPLQMVKKNIEKELNEQKTQLEEYQKLRDEIQVDIQTLTKQIRINEDLLLDINRKEINS